MVTIGGAIGRGIASTVPPKMPEQTYSNNVLVGNWFEERFADTNDKKAITPGIYGQSDCVQERPLYQRDFGPPITVDSCRDIGDYNAWRQQGFSNRLNGESTNIKLWDGDQYETNITTTKDLMFRIVPGKFDLVNGKPERDLMRSYGNCTKTGLLQWRSCEEWRDRNTPADMSHYKNAFKRPPMVVRQPRCKGPQRKTSIT